MPGLVGILSSQITDSNIEELLSKMCQAIKHENWHKTDVYSSDTVGFGRVHLGTFNPESQPIFNEDRTLCILMEGKIYGYQATKQQLLSKGQRFSNHNDAEFILHLYEEYGEEFVHKLNGSFTLVIWDEKTQKLLIVNDRYGTRSIYYTPANNNGYFLFGSEVKAIIQDKTFKMIVDDRSVAEFFIFGYLLGTKTFFQGVELLAPASILTYEKGQVSITQYWDFDFNEEYEDRPEEYYVEKLSQLILQAVERQMKGNYRIGVPLSGGLDSRTIVASINKKHYPLHTFTIGMANCDDANFAQIIANKLGANHNFFEFQPEDLASYAEKAVYLSDGMQNCIHAHRMQTYNEARAFMNVALLGTVGDSVMGSTFLSDDLAEGDDDFNIFKANTQYTPPNQLRNLFKNSYFPLIEENYGSSIDYIIRTGENVNIKLPGNKSTYYNLKERQLEMATQALAKILVSQINAKYFEKNKNKKKSKKDISF